MATGENITRPSAFSGMTLIVRREVSWFFRSRTGYLVTALLLLLTGAAFNFLAIGSSAQYSTDVLHSYFYWSSGLVMVLGLIVSMRSLAEERASGSLPLLTTSSLSDGEIVVAKFLAAYTLVFILTVATVYIPLFVFVNGKVSLGHIFAGYVGLFCLGAMATAIGTFGSAVGESQLVALVISAVILVFGLLLWTGARVIDGPLGDVVGYMSLHDKHFKPFQNGTINLKDVVFYLSVSLFFLMLARNSLEGRRWKP